MYKLHGIYNCELNNLWTYIKKCATIYSNRREFYMARLIRPTLAIRCVQSGCKCLFEVAQVEDGKQQEVVCPQCGEHYVYPIYDEENK